MARRILRDNLYNHSDLLKNEMLFIDEKIHAGFKFYMGKYKNIDIIVTNCGVGNADDEATIIYEEFEKISADTSAKLVLKMLELLANE